MSKDHNDEQKPDPKPQAEQAGKVTDEVLDAVSGGGPLNPDGTVRPINYTLN